MNNIINMQQWDAERRKREQCHLAIVSDPRMKPHREHPGIAGGVYGSGGRICEPRENNLRSDGTPIVTLPTEGDDA